MNRVLLVTLIAALLAAAGCIEYEENLLLNADGSGTIEVKYGMDMSLIEHMDSVMSGNESKDLESDEAPFDRSEVDSLLNSGDYGVELVDYSDSLRDGWQYWNMKFSFESLDGLNEFMAEMQGLDDEIPSSDGGRYYEEQPDGSHLFTYGFIPNQQPAEEMPFDFDDSDDMPGDYDDSASEADWEDLEWNDSLDYDDYSDSSSYEDELDEFGDKMADAMKGMADGMGSLMGSMDRLKFKVTVQLPGEIVETNATSYEGNTATWEFDSGSLMMGSDISEMTARVK